MMLIVAHLQNQLEKQYKFWCLRPGEGWEYEGDSEYNYHGNRWHAELREMSIILSLWISTAVSETSSEM